ncbi:MAG: hypothetical protein AB7O24_22760 [Kofleriaceae bacterium]
MQEYQIQQFRIFRALGFAFRAWFRNFIPFTLLGGLLYSPMFIWLFTRPAEMGTGPDQFDSYFNTVFVYPIYMLTAATTLIAPLLTYRIVQQLNGTRVSMGTSLVFGLRGIPTALLIAVINAVLGFAPFGGIATMVLGCIWFVATPAAVAEKLGPFRAMSRSSELTSGRRWGIFGLTLLIGVIAVIVGAIILYPMLYELDGFALVRRAAMWVLIVVCVLQMFSAMVAAVSYALLRKDKEGMTDDQLARIFE